MSLDHDSGDLDGRILDGRYAGTLLSQLDLASLMELVDDYRIADHQSASVLEAYLDRVRPEWRGDGAAGESEAGTGGAEDGNQAGDHQAGRSEEHTSELQSLMRISYAVFCLK